MPERRPPGFFERFRAKKPAAGGELQQSTDFLTRELSAEEKKEMHRRELADWTSELEKRLGLPEGRVRTDTLEMGGKTAKQLETEMTKAGFLLDGFAKQILTRANLSKERTVVDAVQLTVEDLGFLKGVSEMEFVQGRGVTNLEIVNRGKELGLDLCPPDVGPELRLSMQDQPSRDEVFIVMETIMDSEGDRDVFRVYASRDNKLRLGCTHWRPDDKWYFSDKRFAFIRRKP